MKRELFKIVLLSMMIAIWIITCYPLCNLERAERQLSGGVGGSEGCY